MILLDVYSLCTTLPYSHLHQCRELEQSRDACVSEQFGLQEQVEGLHKALQEHQTLLAEKVCV